MINRPYRKDDFQSYDVVQWYGAIKKELKQSEGYKGLKGEVLAMDVDGNAVRATSADAVSNRVFFQWNIVIGKDGSGWDAKASGTVTTIAGAHEADTLLYDTAATYAIDAELTYKEMEYDGDTSCSGIALAIAGDPVIAVVDKLPADNRQALRIKVLDQPYVKA